MMTKHDPELEPFATFIGEIDPWLGQVVLIGGWPKPVARG
jgi:hypothetical protein